MTQKKITISQKKQTKKKQVKKKQTMKKQTKKKQTSKEQTEKKQTSGKKANYHDVLFKMCLNNIERAKEFLSLALPKQTLDLFEWKNLREEKDSFPEKRADLIFSAPFKDKNPSKELKNESRVFFLIEHKSNYDSKTFFQIFTYKNELVIKSYENNKKARAMISILFYHGKTPWNPNKTFQSEIFEDSIKKLPPELRENHKVFILDIHSPKVRAAIQDPKCKIRGFLKLFLDSRKLEPNEALLYRYVLLFRNWRGDKRRLALALWNYFQSVNPGISKELLKKVAKKAIKNGIFPKGGSMDVIDLIRQEGWEQGIQEGRQEGRKEGIQEGRQEGQKKVQQVVSNMFQNNMDISLISKATGLSQKEIKKLKNGK